MKKSILNIAFASTLLLASCGVSNKKAEMIEPQMTSMDSVSYAFGIINGKQFANYIEETTKDFNLNNSKVSEGFTTALNGISDSVFNQNRDYFSKWVEKFEAEKNKELVSKNKEYLDNNAKKDGVVVTNSGLQYQVIRPAEGEKPTAVDTVVVDYEGRLIDGTKFDSSYDRKQPTEFPLNQVIKGWTEGIALMSAGSKYQFTIPSELAYGERGAGNVIPPHSTLIFDVELSAIKKYKEESTKEEPTNQKEKSSKKSKKTKKRNK